MARILILFFCASLAHPACAQNKVPCDPNFSPETKIMLGCEEKNTDQTLIDNQPDRDHKGAPVKVPQPAKAASLSDIKAFLLSIAEDIAPITPPPFDKYSLDTIVQHDNNRNAYYLVFPDSHTLSDTSMQKISARLEYVLPRVARFMDRYQNVRAEIEVHTDGRAVTEKRQDPHCRFSDNFALATCRANYIHRFIEEQGVKNISVIARGDGEAQCFKTKINCPDFAPDFERQIRLVMILSER